MRFTVALTLLLAPLGSALASVPQGGSTQFEHPRLRPAAATLGTRAYFAGGEGSGTGSLEVFDASLASWSTVPLTVRRSGAGAAAVGTQVLIAGGSSDVAWDLDLVEILDASTGVLTLASLSDGRTSPAVTAIGTRAYFAGGAKGFGSGASAAVDVYDASSGQWQVSALSAPRQGLAATSIGNLALFAGGRSSAAPFGTARVDLLDAGTGIWSTASLARPRHDLAAAAVGTKALFAGGWGDMDFSDLVDIYDGSNGTWSTAQLSQPRYSLVATTVGTKVFFGGGYAASGHSDVVDVYDDATGTWSTLQLGQARSFASAASVGGLALFAGGMVDTLGTLTDLVDLLPADDVLSAYCFGDGSGAACPCANVGGAGEGCRNSGGAGALLGSTGWVSVSSDDLTLEASQLLPGQPALAFAGQAATSSSFGDGLRCAGNQIVRLGTTSASVTGSASFGPGLAALGGWSAGDVRYLQVWYRDPLGPCASGSNTSPGIEAHFFP